jgi:antibiotic biosynthesis monooxygenase (ABM) superfamily enzyme
MNASAPRASSVIVHRVPPEHVERFLAWQQGIIRAASTYPGYQATESYPPLDVSQHEWVIVLHFDNDEAQQRWLASPLRAEWLARRPPEIEDFRLKTLPTGFGPWFASMLDAPSARPLPAWKMMLTVLLGLYPTVMLLNIFVGPHFRTLGLAASMLIGNALSVVILQWVVMPVLQAVLGPWLRADPAKGMGVTVGGCIFIALLLGGLALLFRQMTG